MKPTRRGVYYVLAESPHRLTIGRFTYAFSSAYHMDKFRLGHILFRREMGELLGNRYGFELNVTELSDWASYVKIESRGFHIELDGVRVWRLEV